MNKIFGPILAIFVLTEACFAFPVIVKDDFGTAFFSVSSPKRIISTMPSNTEILYALGLGSNIIAVSDKCNFPPDALKKKKIGAVNINVEEIVALNPDLILMLGDAQKRQIEVLKRYRLPVFVINPRSLADLTRSISVLGKLTRTERSAGKIVWKINNDILAAKPSAGSSYKPKIFVELWHDPMVTAAGGTFIDDIISISGGVNIGKMAGNGYPSYSIESLIVQDPDFIIVAGKSPEDIKRIRSDKRLANLTAVKENKILLIDSDIITRPTPRLITALNLIKTFIRKPD